MSGVVALSLILWLAGRGDASNSMNITSYDVVTTQIRYLPAEPFHITDMRNPDKSDFETRTVYVHQPFQNGQPLHARPVIFSCTAALG
jgi:hypothetical protein